MRRTTVGGTQFRHARLLHDAATSYMTSSKPGDWEDSSTNLLAATNTLLAYADGGGLSVALLTESSKQTREPSAYVRVGSKIRCLAWHPSGNAQLLTGCGDGVVRLWQATGERDVTEAAVSLLGGGGDCGQDACFHPSAPAIVAAAGGAAAHVWDQTRPDAPLLSCSPLRGSGSSGGGGGSGGGSADAITSLAWSYAGDLLIAADRGGALTVRDPRSGGGGGGAAAAVAACHAKGAMARAVWANDSSYIITAGAGALTRERECAVWDSRALDAGPVRRTRIGGPAGSGFLLPLLDHGSNLLFLCGRGDATARVLEFDAVAGALTPLPAAAAALPPRLGAARAYALLPKRACDAAGAEVARLYRLVDGDGGGGGGGVQALRCEVPRRDRTRFAEELFPPCPAAVQDLAAADWLAGADVPPRLAPVAPVPPPPTAQQQQQSGGAYAAQDGLAPLPHAATAAPPLSSAQANVAAAVAAADAEAEAAAAVVVAAAVTATARFRVASGSRLRHVRGSAEGAPAVTGLTPLLTALDAPILACGLEFWAVPWVGGGGPVYVSPLGAAGRVAPHCTALLNGHRAPARALAFSPLHSSVLATGAEDGSLRVWCVPPGGPQGPMGVEDAAAALQAGHHPLRQLEWHPAAEGLLLSAGGDAALRFLDLEREAEALCVALPSAVSAMALDWRGARVAAACRDGRVRLLDARSGAAVAESGGGGGAQHRQVCWSGGCGPDDQLLITTGVAAGGQRTLFTWDARSMDAPLHAAGVDYGTGALLPSADAATGLILLASRGDAVIRCYELADGGAARACSDWRSSSTSAGGGGGLCGGALVPPSPRTRDVARVEAARYLRLSDAAVEEVRFCVPRADDLRAYFQDDVYRGAVRAPAPACGAAAWLAGDGADAAAAAAPLLPLRPPHMTPLSERPVDAAAAAAPHRAARFRQEIEARDALEAQRRSEFDRLAALANQNAEFNPNLSGGPRPGEKDDSDWDD